jgi:dTDP-4-dehydrorhamnose 3,5-epimerase
MRFTPTGLPGVVLIEPDVYRDSRGFFLETFHARRYAEGGLPGEFVQDNHSSSIEGTLRGLHLQVKKPQGKLVRVVEGEIWDVAADVRPDSPTFGQWTAEVLSAENFRQLYVPEGFAHGFCVLRKRAQVVYKCTTLYDPHDEAGIAYDDPDLNIRWPIETPLLSERDRNNPKLAAMLDQLSCYGSLAR